MSYRGPFDGRAEPLTPREIEVLRLIAEGVSSRDIGARLGISYATVRSHIRSVCSKLDVHSKTEAVVKAKLLSIIG